MKYRAATSENFYFLEIKSLARTYKDNPGISKSDLLEYVKIQGIIETNTESNFRKKYSTIQKRFFVLNDYLQVCLIEEPSDIAKFINFVSIILNERIMFDFLNEVVRNKFCVFDQNIDDIEFINFIRDKAEQEEKVAKWTEPTRQKIIVKIKNYFVEAGYLIKQENIYKIRRPLIPADIIETIKKDYGETISKAILLEN